MQDFTVLSYAIYLLLSITVTIWVARTLHRNGRVFLVTAFHGDETLADSVNHLLVVGFYLLNIGWVTLALRTSDTPETVADLFELLSYKLGIVLLVLGAMHFLNLYGFNKMRKDALYLQQPPPVEPDDTLEPAVGPELIDPA